MLHILKSLSSFILAAALAYFAYALISVANEVRQTREALPQLLDQIQNVEKNIDVAAWLELAKHIDTQVPEILTEVGQVRNTVNDINTQIPGVLAEVKALRTETFPPLLQEIQLMQTKTVPDVLTEVKAVREMTPGTINSMENLVDHAHEVASDASEGAIEGSAIGILKLPLNIIEKAGSAIIGGDEKSSDSNSSQ